MKKGSKGLIILAIACVCLSASAGAGYAFRCDLGFEDCSKSQAGTPAPTTPDGTPAPTTPDGTPASTLCKATVYKDKDYEGDFKEITANIPVLKDTDFGSDNISSIKLSGDCGIVKLHDNDNYGGKFIDVWEDIPDLRGYDFNDKTSAISFGEYGKNKCRVQLFENTEYGGKIRNITESISSLNDLGFNDKVSSMKVGGDCGTVTVYKDSNFKNDPRVITGDIYNNISSVAYNDGISSIKIE